MTTINSSPVAPRPQPSTTAPSSDFTKPALDKAKPLTPPPATTVKPPTAPFNAKDFFSPGKTMTQNYHNGGTGLAGRGLGAAGLAGGVVGIGTNAHGLSQAVKNGDGHAIAENAIGLARGVLGTTKGALETAAAFSSAKSFDKLGQVAKDLVGGKGPLPGAVANAAAEAAHKGGPLRHADAMASVLKDKGLIKGGIAGAGMAVAELLHKGHMGGLAGKIEGQVIKSGEKAAGGAGNAAKVTQAADAALDGVKAGAKGAGTAAKVAGRFVPGLNIGLAALDVGQAARTWADPKSTTGAKVTSTISAAGSVAAATNIPIVSQVGAGISAVSSLVGAFLPKKNG